MAQSKKLVKMVRRSSRPHHESLEMLKTKQELAAAKVGSAALNVMKKQPNKPDKKRSFGRRKGVTSHRTFSEYIYDLFMVNECLAQPLKKSDATLQEILLAEFPDIQLKHQFEKGTYTINDLRTRFNRGRFGNPKGLPPRVSFRYGYGKLQGLPVNFRTGTRRLTTSEATIYIRKYRGIMADSNQFLPKGLAND